MHQLLLHGKSIGNIKGVLFDKDGTLSNSEEHLVMLAKARINSAIKKFTEFKEEPNFLLYLEDLLKSLYGLSPEGLDPTGLLAIASREQNLISTATIFSIIGQNWPTSLSLAQEIFLAADSQTSPIEKETGRSRPILSGVKNFLLNLEKEKIKSGLITNDSMQGTQEFIQNNNLENTFLYLSTSENQPCKPNPLAVKDLCSSMNLRPSECALISDADTDLKMASKANIGVIIGFKGGWKIQPDLHEGNFLMNNWDEIEIHQTP